MTIRYQTTQIIMTGTILPWKISESSGIYLTGMRPNITTFKLLTFRTVLIHSILRLVFKLAQRIDSSTTTMDGNGMRIDMDSLKNHLELPLSGLVPWPTLLFEQ